MHSIGRGVLAPAASAGEAAQDVQDILGRQFEFQHGVSRILCMALQTQYTYIRPIYQLKELVMMPCQPQ